MMKTIDMMKTIMERTMSSQIGDLPKHIGIKNTTIQNAVMDSPIVVVTNKIKDATIMSMKPLITSRKPIFNCFIKKPLN